MNERNYEMDFDERRDYVLTKASEVLQEDSDLFVRMCEELDNWNGFLGDTRMFDMSEIDEFFSKPSELLDKMNDFDADDDYFYFDVYGVTTASDKYDIYSDNFDADEVIDAIVENYNHIDIDDATLKELVEIIVNEDFGIEEDWEYDEDMDEDDEPEETDEEFMDRINDIV